MTPTACLVVTASFRTSSLRHSSFNVTSDLQDGAEGNDFARVVSTAPSHASFYEVAAAAAAAAGGGGGGAVESSSGAIVCYTGIGACAGVYACV